MLDWTVHVTAGNTVVSGRIVPARANALRFGVASPRSAGVRPTTFRTTVRCTSVSAATDAIARERVARRRSVIIEREASALPEERNGVPPDDRLDGGVCNALATHLGDRLR